MGLPTLSPAAQAFLTDLSAWLPKDELERARAGLAGLLREEVELKALLKRGAAHRYHHEEERTDRGGGIYRYRCVPDCARCALDRLTEEEANG